MEKIKVKGKNSAAEKTADKPAKKITDKKAVSAAVPAAPAPTGKAEGKADKKAVSAAVPAEKINITEKTVTKKKINIRDIMPITTPSLASISVQNYKNNIKKRNRIKRLFMWSFIIFAFLFLAFGFAAPYIFTDTGHWTYEYFVTNTVNVRNIGIFFRDKIPDILQSIMVIIIFYIVINLTVLSVTKMSLRNKRTKTVAGMVNSFTKYVGFFIMVVTLLRMWGINTTAILSGAAIFSAVIALGAQSLVSDILAGIFMVFENNFAVGDIITIEGNNGNFRGYVENIGIRTTQIRAELGEVMIIANSQMKKIVNQSMHRCGIICAVTVNHDENTDRIEKIVNENIQKIGENIPEITEGPVYLGVSEITPNGTVLKFFAKCDESLRYKTTRRLLQEIKILFNKNNIKFAVDKLEIHSKK